MKRKIIISLMFILLISVGIIYKINTSSTDKIYLNEDNITNIKQQVGIYVENENGTYKKTNNIPSQEDGYVLDTENSMCEGNTTIGWDNNSWSAVINNIEKENLKCYLYFRYKTAADSAKEKSLGTVDSFTGTSCDSGCDLTENGIYEAEDDFGTSYYYRGTVSNNWLVFGKEGSNYIWWRIIRINGNGSIRIMYAGTSNSKTSAPSTTGDETMINPKQSTGNSTYPRAVYFNQTYNDNKYVGYMYPGQKGSASTDFDGAHKVDSSSTESDALTQIKQWYNSDTNLGTLAAQYIDVDTGFCSDSSLAQGNHSPYTGNGYGTSQSGYAGLDRVWQQNSTSTNTSEQKPTLKCGYDVIGKQLNKEAQKRDLYTGPGATSGGTKGLSGNVEGNNALPVPVGLITMDEVIYAGGFYGKANANYWLKTDKYYWTMSPYNYYYSSSSSQYARVFSVRNDGYLGYDGVGNTINGVRPVINLKAGTNITTQSDGGEGSRTNPYVVGT